MNMNRIAKAGLGILGAIVVFGCLSMAAPTMKVNQVVPMDNQSMAIDQIILLVDASASLKDYEIFAYEKSLVEAFSAAMPDADYHAGIISFGENEILHKQTLLLKRFNRDRMIAGAADLKYLGGMTPLEQALKTARENLVKTTGKSAIVVFSDGKPYSEQDSLSACRKLIQAQSEVLCVHTVHMGSSREGAEFLEQLANLSSCGSFRTAEDINNPSAMESFVREVLLGSVMKSEVTDSDGDGVPDNLDQCAGTPKGVTVDMKGCPLDSDGDGVYDYQDQCLGTPMGAKVDARGCWIIKGLNFDTDQSVIKPEFNNLLNDVATVLKDNKDVKIRIEGYTDSRGTDAYNQKLSERRAEAVKQYLVNAGIASNLLASRGFGEGNSVAPNTSPENMYLNRRVELTVIEKVTYGQNN
jgi:OOP family OmpA-OmpF porin